MFWHTLQNSHKEKSFVCMCLYESVSNAKCNQSCLWTFDAPVFTSWVLELQSWTTVPISVVLGSKLRVLCRLGKHSTSCNNTCSPVVFFLWPRFTLWLLLPRNIKPCFPPHSFSCMTSWTCPWAQDKHVLKSECNLSDSVVLKMPCITFCSKNWFELFWWAVMGILWISSNLHVHWYMPAVVLFTHKEILSCATI